MAVLRAMGRTLGRLTGRAPARLVEDYDDPELPVVREAAEAADWNLVQEMVLGRAEKNDGRALMIWAVAETPGVERWIPKVIEAEPDAALPRLIGGFRQISWGWEARTGAWAKHVSREQFQTFHERLRTGEEWLFEAAERAPDWVAPWHGLLTTGRGLQVGQAVAHRRFQAAIRRDPHHFGVHISHMQQVCEKWGGSHEAMHEFAKTAALKAPAGTWLGGLVADAHIEQWLRLEGGADDAYIVRPEVTASLNEAADHSYRHPDFDPEGPGVNVLNSFAMAFSLNEEPEAAREAFAATEGRVTESPWHYLNGSDPVDSYKRMRSAAGR
ncbi:hypothetical protein [Streptomyces qinzhouensis]|uniref:hypothetical protein n=1 Tax=Streptomyces qinzhouensis TaxID=2599401 RepID=UPI001644E6C2|nr:hypothetical protein [Streptomyces qinzhouensis]